MSGVDTRRYRIVEETRLIARVRGEGLQTDYKPLRKLPRTGGYHVQLPQLIVSIPFRVQGEEPSDLIQGQCRLGQMVMDPDDADYDPDTDLPATIVADMVRQARADHGLTGKALLNRRILITRYSVERKRDGVQMEIYDFNGLAEAKQGRASPVLAGVE